jgi:hypothetical protein
MNEAVTLALCEANMEHWFSSQVTADPGAFSLLHRAAADHWAYSLKLFSCWGVTLSRVLSDIQLSRCRMGRQDLPCLLEFGAPRASDAKERQLTRSPFMVACWGLEEGSCVGEGGIYPEKRTPTGEDERIGLG